jgi:beta-glucanase (GH16 family)
MDNLINPDLWVYAVPWGNSPSTGTVANYQPECVWISPLGNEIYFGVEKKDNVGWYMNEQWQPQTRTRLFQAGWIVSKDKFFHGTYEMECKLPNFLNSFPAWWLYDIGNPKIFEFDIFEQFRKDLKDSRHEISTTYHWGSNYTTDHYQRQGTLRKCLPIDRAFHLFRLEWYPDRMTTFMDNKMIFDLKDIPIMPTAPMNMLVNSGLGDWNPTTDTVFEPFIVRKLQYQPL